MNLPHALLSLVPAFSGGSESGAGGGNALAWDRGGDVHLALDAVRDPGNLGTIIRCCDWFGLRHLILSADCCDCFNPKVVRATSGSLARVQVLLLLPLLSPSPHSL